MVMTAGSIQGREGHVAENFHSGVKGTGTLEVRTAERMVLGPRYECVLTKLSYVGVKFTQNTSVTFRLLRVTQPLL